MAPTFNHYWPVPMDESSTRERWSWRRQPWLVSGILGVLLAIVFGFMIYFAVKANSPACKDGLRAEQECQNRTHLLEHQLTRAQDVLLETEAQAAACNQTVETLKASLKKEKAQSHELQERIKKLNQELNTIREQGLRKENEASGGENSSTSSGNTLSRCVVTLLLAVSLHALLA